MSKNLKFYVDFDGTITQTDVVDRVLERFADKAWQEVEAEWQSGKIGSRECLDRQVAFLKTTPEALEAFCADVKIDAHFIDFLKSARELGVPVAVVSDGFENVIHPVLKRVLAPYPELLKALPVYANRIEWAHGRPKASFFSAAVCAHGCANCKPEAIRKTAATDDRIVFIGDGLSDRYAAKRSDLTFAKGKLLRYCAEEGINHLPYQNFGRIEEWLRENAAAAKSSR